jgi:hypothetical protein
MNERSKLDAELTSNVGGERRADANLGSGDADDTNEFIVVTLVGGLNRHGKASWLRHRRGVASNPAHLGFNRLNGTDCP